MDADNRITGAQLLVMEANALHREELALKRGRPRCHGKSPFSLLFAAVTVCASTRPPRGCACRYRLWNKRAGGMALPSPAERIPPCRRDLDDILPASFPAC